MITFEQFFAIQLPNHLLGEWFFQYRSPDGEMDFLAQVMYIFILFFSLGPPCFILLSTTIFQYPFFIDMKMFGDFSRYLQKIPIFGHPDDFCFIFL